MSVPPPEAGGPGGVLYCEYVDTAAGERHALRLHVAAFDPTPSGPENDYLYTGAGPVVPTESGVLATFASLGALWRNYFPPQWSFQLVDVWQNVAGTLHRLDTVPLAAPMAGTSTDPIPANVTTKRVFHLSAPGGGDRRLFLSQTAAPTVSTRMAVSPSTGGLDARDRGLMAYLSGTDTGIVSSTGRRFLPDAVVASLWARRTLPVPVGSGGGERDTFIGPTAPPAPEEGWLWVDTSGGTPPWPLWVFNATAIQRVDVVNHGFEVPVVGEGTFVFTPPDAGWDFEGSAAVVGNHSPVNATNDAAPEGAQVALIQFNGTITQTLTVTVALDYVVKAMAAERADDGNWKTITVRLDGVAVATWTMDTKPSYAAFVTAPVALDAGSHILQFDGVSGETDATALLDDVRVESAAAVGAWQPVGSVSSGGGGGTGGGTGGDLPADCIVFPLGASICNDIPHVLHFNTTGGTHAMNDTGITLPGGHRLEVVP